MGKHKDDQSVIVEVMYGDQDLNELLARILDLYELVKEDKECDDCRI